MCSPPPKPISKWSGRIGRAEQALRRHRAFRRHRDLRQQRVDQLLLAGAQRLALAAAIEAVQGGRVAGLVGSHAAGARHSANGRQ
jgi:hypothetical protein